MNFDGIPVNPAIGSVVEVIGGVMAVRGERHRAPRSQGRQTRRHSEQDTADNQYSPWNLEERLRPVPGVTLNFEAAASRSSLTADGLPRRQHHDNHGHHERDRQLHAAKDG